MHKYSDVAPASTLNFLGNNCWFVNLPFREYTGKVYSLFWIITIFIIIANNTFSIFLIYLLN